MPKERNILLCVSGPKPAIITETLWCLTQGHNSENRRFPIDEIHVITTLSGKKDLEKCLFKTGRFEQFKEDYPECRKIEFSERFVHILTTEKTKKPAATDSSAIQLKDVITGDENECAANQIYLVLKDLVENSTRLHASAAGGRKTLSIYMTVMMQLLARGEDTLSHVIVWGRYMSDRKFCYPPPDDLQSGKPLPIALAFIPFIRLREVGRKLIDELTIEEKSYSEAVKTVSESLRLDNSREELTFDVKNLTVAVADKTVKISGTRLMIALVYANLGKNISIPDRDLTFEHFDAAFYTLTGEKFRFADITREMIAENAVGGDTLDAYNSLKKIAELLRKKDVEADEDFCQKMREWRNRINNDVFRKKAGFPKRFDIQNNGGYGEAKYGFNVGVTIK